MIQCDTNAQTLLLRFAMLFEANMNPHAFSCSREKDAATIHSSLKLVVAREVAASRESRVLAARNKPEKVPLQCAQ